MKIGYARVSTRDQNVDMQITALEQFGCEIIFSEKASGKDTHRPEFQSLLNYIRKGDTLVVWKLDRLGRSNRDLVNIVHDLQQKGVDLVFLTENFDTTTVNGKMMFHLFCAMAEAERERIRERTHAGLAEARARGRKGGRPVILTEDKVRQIKTLAANRNLSVGEICEMVKVKRGTYYKALRLA